MSARELLLTWLRRQLAAPARAWLDERLEALRAEPSSRTLYLALGYVPRTLGRGDLVLRPADLEAAARARPGWDPGGLSTDQAARILMLLEAAGESRGFPDRFRQLCRTADVGELIAFYRGLPLYPEPEALEAQAAEGVRSNMRAVFEAVAHRNPYPRERFGPNRWNHMVLKALFVGAPLHPIQGLDERANPELAGMLADYAHERWAAGRSVSPELWRCVGPFAQGDLLGDLQRTLAAGSEVERKAAALALRASPDPRARELLASAPEQAAALERGELSWDRLAVEL